jgi:hypothetical protein
MSPRGFARGAALLLRRHQEKWAYVVKFGHKRSVSASAERDFASPSPPGRGAELQLWLEVDTAHQTIWPIHGLSSAIR